MECELYLIKAVLYSHYQKFESFTYLKLVLLTFHNKQTN